MKNYLFIAFAATLLASCTSESAKEKPDSESYKYSYRQFNNDPFGVLEYTLENGLKVYMSINPDEPRITSNIVVNAGSKNDPSDATGLAHYLEHMLFKGTSKIASKDWATEKELLQQISDTYEKRRTVTDEDERIRLYSLIDSLSVEAAKYCIPNEYDKMISTLGAKGTNAYTSLERTVYTNDIPANELERWLLIESERFSELVLRLFHTELEAVYEEFNMGQDSDYRIASRAMMKALFKKHTYGTQSTIGTGEHLKNPSMEKIHEFFNTYYVPNNMAIVLAGDLDPDNTIDLITKYFGGFESKDVPEFIPAVEDPIDSVEIYDIYGRDAEWVTIGYRLPGVDNKDLLAAEMMANVLWNGSSGLIDLNLLKDQKILSGWAFSSIDKDYSSFELRGNPREGQTLDEVKELLLAEVQKVKDGAFEDWLLPAVIKDYKLQEYRSNEYNGARSYYISDAFIMGQDWQEVVDNISELSKLTKQDIVDFANKYMQNDNYIVVNKHTGDSDPYKVDKPEITQIDLNRSMESAFMTEFNAMESGRLTPQFIKYDEEIETLPLKSGVKLNYVENLLHPTFDLSYVLEMGSLNDREMALAISYLKYLGTDKYSAAELEQEFYKLGMSFGVYASSERIYVTLSGLEESLEEGIKLFEHFLNNVTADQNAYDLYIEGKLKSRKNAKLSKWRIHRSGLENYARFGALNPYNDVVSEEELREVDISLLADKIKSISSYKHSIYYYGQKDMNEVASLLDAHHEVPSDLKDYPDKRIYVELPTEGNKVYFAHYDMVQVEMLMKSNVGEYDPDKSATSRLFNEYFGSGLSSIVFQEIRESKALAYSAYAYYSSPNDLKNNHYVNAYVGSQSNKFPDAVAAMIELMNNMPEAEDQFEQSKQSALKKIESTRTKRSSFYWRKLFADKMNYDEDRDERIYNELKGLEFSDMKTFYDENIKGLDYTFLIIGDREQISMETLESLGTVQELTLEDIFGY